jgi:3-(3-hydroxy-phenyl)propionate hydroxylase
MVKPVSCDGVIVVGAGPVGCTAALALAQAGVPVTLIEAETALPKDMRASTFHPPTLDLIAPFGLTERLIPQGIIAPRYQYRDRISGEYAEFDLGLLDGIVAHPYRLQCEQFKLTQTVADMLAALGNAELRMGTRLTGVTQDGDGVTATVESSAGVETLRGRFLIGADGARSVVRKEVDIAFEGFTYPEQFLVVSTEHPLERHFANLSHINYVSDREEWCAIVRVPTQWRVLFPAPPEAAIEDLTDPDALEARLQRLAPKPGRYDIAYVSLYRVHQRVAERYRSGNVLLAGDAAHLNNPIGGMGMNGGLHDAVNLCEKLVAILCDGGGIELLDLYERQRRTVTVEFIQAQSAQNKKNIEEVDDAARLARIKGLRDVAADPAQAVAFLRRNNMVDSLERSCAIT